MHEKVNLVAQQTRRPIVLDEEMLEAIAEAAAEKAIKKLEARMYQEVGKTFVKGLFYIIGAVLVGLWAYGKHEGWIK